MNKFAIEFDMIALGRLGGEICADPAIDLDPAGGD
jgi:hypothetical protein